MTKWYLQVRTWQYITELARHWYGTLRPDLESKQAPIELEHRIGQKEAIRRNREEGLAIWSADDMTRAFESEEEVIAAAALKFEEISTDEDLLLIGNYACCDPMMVLAGPDELVSKLNSIYESWIDIDGWEKREHRQRAEELCKLWDETLS